MGGLLSTVSIYTVLWPGFFSLLFSWIYEPTNFQSYLIFRDARRTSSFENEQPMKNSFFLSSILESLLDYLVILWKAQVYSPLNKLCLNNRSKYCFWMINSLWCVRMDWNFSFQNDNLKNRFSFGLISKIQVLFQMTN